MATNNDIKVYVDKVIDLLNALHGQGSDANTHEQVMFAICLACTALGDPCEFSKDDIATEYESTHGVRTYTDGITLAAKKDDSWFYHKQDATHDFQSRYEKYLKDIKHYDSKAIDNITSEAASVLKYCANPDENSTEKKSGLVIGDIQSGKTSNYLALANIAIDYGYKLIVILTGITEALRIQTQERLDEGIVGAESSTIANDSIEFAGVGIEDRKYYAVPLTNSKNDFTKLPSSSPEDYSKPLVLAVKKNKKVLESLKKWLKPGDEVSSKNILIIDDECDNASVNTRSEENPTTINNLIRDLYANFQCATYVGYTATPFANIFIDPDAQADEKDDLFPKDFIHRLKTTSESYFGANKVFEDEKSPHVCFLNPDEPDLPPSSHKRDYVMQSLPDSLKDAICTFLICNCVRTLRHHPNDHRSMMINMSPYNDPQKNICFLVEQYVKELNDYIHQNDLKTKEEFCRLPELKRIVKLYETDPLFNTPDENGKTISQDFSFEEIKGTLDSEISQFEVTVMNSSKTKDNRYKYSEKTNGARVIIIGGYVLSRGLTLEGLMISYYNRKARAYDTLLQMCRWFGYRPGYEDLCRVYMSHLNYDCFLAVLDSIADLDEQLEIMNAQGKTPNDFGLMVKESPDILETSLSITARNKSKNTKEVVRPINLSGAVIDTSKLFKDPDKNKANIQRVRNLIDYCERCNKKIEKIEQTKAARYMIRNVQPETIADFLRSLTIPVENRKFSPDIVAEFIDHNQFYSSWDIVFATGNSRAAVFELNEKYTIYAPARKFDYDPDEDFIRISGHNNRLIDPGIFDVGLDARQMEQVKAKAKARAERTHRSDTETAKDYLSVEGRNPVLVILPIDIKTDDDEGKRQIKEAYGEDLLFGFGIGFAGRNDNKVVAKYKINKVKESELENPDEEDFDDE